MFPAVIRGSERKRVAAIECALGGLFCLSLLRGAQLGTRVVTECKPPANGEPLATSRRQQMSSIRGLACIFDEYWSDKSAYGAGAIQASNEHKRSAEL